MGLEATYAVHFKPIGKLEANIDWRRRFCRGGVGHFGGNFQVEGDVLTNHLCTIR